MALQMLIYGTITSIKVGYRRKKMSGIIGVSPDMKSGVVGKYPAGHIIQTASDYWQPNTQWSPTQPKRTTDLSIAFTPVSSSSNIHLFAYFGMVNQTTTQSSRTLFDFYKDSVMLSPGTNSYGAAYVGENTTSIAWYRSMSIFLVISSYSGTSTIDVRLDGTNTRNMHVNGNNWLTIQEVAQ